MTALPEKLAGLRGLSIEDVRWIRTRPPICYLITRDGLCYHWKSVVRACGIKTLRSARRFHWNSPTKGRNQCSDIPRVLAETFHNLPPDDPRLIRPANPDKPHADDLLYFSSIQEAHRYRLCNGPAERNHLGYRLVPLKGGRTIHAPTMGRTRKILGIGDRAKLPTGSRSKVIGNYRVYLDPKRCGKKRKVYRNITASWPDGRVEVYPDFKAAVKGLGIAESSLKVALNGFSCYPRPRGATLTFEDAATP